MSIEQDFWRFHRLNPHVYDELIAMTREAKAHGLKRIGMKMLFEVLRWNTALRTYGDEFKLCNNYTAYYARLIMVCEPDLDGMFVLRRLRKGEEDE